MNEAGKSTHGARRVMLAVAIILCLGPASACGFVGGGGSDEQTLVFGGFGGSLEQGMKSEVIPAFEEEFGVDVTYVTGTSDELMARARQSSPGIDVMWTNDTTHHNGKSEDLFAELDLETVTNLDSVYDVARDPDDVGVITGIQALGLNYNTEAYERAGLQPPTSWNDLMDPEVAGHVVGYNFPIGYSNLLLVQLADMNGGSGDDLEPGWDAFQKMVDQRTTWVSPPAQMQSLLADGSAWVAFNGSARAYAAKAAGDPVDFVYPDEGAIAYAQYFDILKSAPHPELAQDFVNFALGEQAQQGMAETAMMGPVSQDVELSEEVAATVPYREEVEQLNFVDSDTVNETLDEVTQRWTRMVGGGNE